MGGPFPPIVNAFLQRTYYVDHRRAGAKGGIVWFQRGPFRGKRAPISGLLNIANQGAGLVTADERIYLPLPSQPAARDIITEIDTAKTFEVVFVQMWPAHVELFVKRMAPEQP